LRPSTGKRGVDPIVGTIRQVPPGVVSVAFVLGVHRAVRHFKLANIVVVELVVRARGVCEGCALVRFVVAVNGRVQNSIAAVLEVGPR
jgi:hypothetical protein